MTQSRFILGTLTLAAWLGSPTLAGAQTCTSDAECGTDMVCHSQTVTQCSGSGPAIAKCDGAERCLPVEPPEPPVCSESTFTSCTYRWALPCNADADCGAGFTCVPSVMGVCSGSAGEGVPASTAPDETDPNTGTAVGRPTTECTTVTSFPGSCRPIATTCTTDADCPSVWTCITYTSGTTTTPGSEPVAVDLPVAGPSAPTVAAAPIPVPERDTGTDTSTSTSTGITTTSFCGMPGMVRGSQGGDPLATGTDISVTYAPPADPTVTKNDGLPQAPGTASGDEGLVEGAESATKTGGGCTLASHEAPGSATLFLVSLFGALWLLRGRRARSR